MSMEKPLVAASTENNFESPKIPLLLKKANQTRSSILLDPDSFDELVKESNILLDRTLFLKALFDAHNRNLMICMPNGFGTSMLLSMAKAFFEYQPEEERWKSDNFAMFSQKFEGNRQFAIMEDQDFVKEHFGAYHVLHIRMKGFYFGDIKELEQQIGLLISELYEDNLAIFDANQDKLESYESRDIQNYIQNPPSDCHRSFALYRLTKYLFKCTNREVIIIILVEDYDSFITRQDRFQIQSDEEWQKILWLIGAFLDIIVCMSHVKQILICGNHCFSRPSSRITVLGLETVVGRQIPINFFGISNQELEELCHSYGFYDVESVRQYYSGFIINGTECCNNFSIIKFFNDWANINDARFRPHFRPIGLMQQFTSFFCNKTIQKTLSTLIKENNNGESPVYDYGGKLMKKPEEWIEGKASVDYYSRYSVVRPLEEEDLTKLLVVANSWDKYLVSPAQVSERFFNLLVSAGILCRRGRLLFLPNHEMKEKLKQMLDDARRKEELENSTKSAS